VQHRVLKDFYERFESAFQREMHAFVQACLGERSLPASLQDATEATRIAHALNRSFLSGQVESV
jgi:myo-inositol 2-dehydrogenase/D-chiro-inositol 1-dehydrogenase